MCTSDNMETQAKLGETSTLYADISVQVFGEWHLLCFLHGYITSGRKAVNRGKKSKLGTRRKSRLHPGRQEKRFYMGLTAEVLRGRWQAAMPASLWVLQLCNVICLWNSSEQQHITNVASIRENVTVEICTQAKTISLTDSNSGRK